MYKIYFLEVCRAERFPTTITTARTISPQFIPFPLGFILLEEPSGRKILVDSGLNEEEASDNAPGAEAFGMKRFGSSSELLDRINIKPEAITDVILTHLHADHAGGVSQFPQATFYLQKEELQYAVTVPEFEFLGGTDYTKRNILNIVRLAFEGKVKFLDGDQELFKGLSVYKTPGHTPGHQIVTVQTTAGIYMILGDMAYSYENFFKEIPISSYVNLVEYLQSFRKIKKIHGYDDRKIIVVHDPETTKYPQVADHVYQIR